jgi:hypothetical protein
MGELPRRNFKGDEGGLIEGKSEVKDEGIHHKAVMTITVSFARRRRLSPP